MKAPLAAGLALGLAACQSTRQDAANLLFCENGEVVEAVYTGDWALVRYKNKLHRMQTAISGSGARYVGGGLEWWTKGLDEGTIRPLPRGDGAPEQAPVSCKAGAPG